MKGPAYRMRRLYRVALRKARTLVQGPPQHPQFVKAAHYLADGWALNFLQVVRPAQLREDFESIRGQGFNTIILVIPWRGFQVDHLVPAYDDFYIRQLERILAAADRAGLSVIVRISYAHQILDRQPLSGLTQMQRLLLDGETQTAWLDYCATVFEICHGFRCFRQGFLSWEEFWHAFGRWQLYRPEYREELMALTGFADYLQAQGLAPMERLPRPEEPGYRQFHGFVNACIREMFERAAARFPGLGMEIRVDKDRQVDADETLSWLSNDSYADLDITRFTYWAPFMGAENRGEILTAEQALSLLDHALGELSDGGKHCNHIVDQFNFVDDAPKFRGIHARIDERQMGEFLTGAAAQLVDKSVGYGVWAYRDYRQNLLFNPRFLMGLAGWYTPADGVAPRRRGGVRMAPGAVLRQVLPARVSGLQTAVPFDSLKLRAALGGRVQGEPELEVRINAGDWVPLEGAGYGELGVTLATERPLIMEDGIVLELRNRGRVLELETLYLFHHVFRGGIHNEYGEPAIHRELVAGFNRAIDAALASREPGETG